jgi:hypothetical protein
MNVEFLGVFTAQAVFLLLASFAVVAIAGLVALWEIDRAVRVCKSVRRVVLQRAAGPILHQPNPTLESVWPTDSLSTRAPPTFPSRRPVNEDTAAHPIPDRLR